MNYRFVFHQIGNILKVVAALMLLPLFVSIIYQESNFIAFLIPMAAALGVGFFLSRHKDVNPTIYAKEGLALVGLAWICVSIFGSLPFVISGQIPNFINAFFETVSGFTTTGASILTNIETLDKSMLFWRSFTHWIGGMGILVFIIAFLPQTNARSMFMNKADSPGPTVGKMTTKIKQTARILYGIYVTLTIIQIILLSFQIPLFDSFTHTFATAGTGGFSIHNASIAHYNSVYVETIITVFMIIYGINFTLFYLLLMRNVKGALKSEELRWYFGFLIVAMLLITINILPLYANLGEAIRYSTFQVASIMSTTGFATADFNNWPTLSKTVLVFLMFIGASAGSTGGGIKVSRIVIYFKMVIREIRYALHPRQVATITFEQKPLDDGVKKSISAYLIAYLSILIVATFIISFEGKDIVTTFTSVVSSLNNIGPGLEIVGPTGNFATFSVPSKLTLILTMLAGRLEIFPILILFAPGLWKQD